MERMFKSVDFHLRLLRRTRHYYGVPFIPLKKAVEKETERLLTEKMLRKLGGVFPGAYVMHYTRDSNNKLTLYCDFPANMEH